MLKIIKSLLILIIIFSLLFYFFYNNSINTSVSKNYSPVDFSIEKGDGVAIVSQKLLNNNLINSDFYFRIYLWKNKIDKKLQAGKYVLSPSMNMKEIINYFVNGETVSEERNVKIIEGWSLFDIANSLEENNISSAKDFLEATEKPVSKWSFDFQKPEFLIDVPVGHDLEGYIYPDTYRIYNNASVSDIIEKALNNFDKKLSESIRAEIENQERSLHDVLTLASIIEKEVINDKDKKIVSGILLKRLDIGMRLEVDSTINYITGKNDPSASYSDLEIDSPYNTYKNYGLPPGPICNPSISSIEAAVYPEESNFLFYLNRQDTLETIFSEDYDEHIRNKNKYLK
jgi:UPF0755 protein